MSKGKHLSGADKLYIQRNRWKRTHKEIAAELGYNVSTIINYLKRLDNN